MQLSSLSLLLTLSSAVIISIIAIVIIIIALLGASSRERQAAAARPSRLWVLKTFLHVGRGWVTRPASRPSPGPGVAEGGGCVTPRGVRGAPASLAVVPSCCLSSDMFV